MKFRSQLLAAILACSLPALSTACELCAIYSADSARGESASGFLCTVSEQYIPYDTLLFEGEPYTRSRFFASAYNHSSITHLVPTYNFSARLGVSLNVPYVYREFHRAEVTPLGQKIDETGSISGLGDTAMVGRWTVLRERKMDHAAIISLLAGVKFPTGDTERLKDERAQEIRLLKIFGRKHAHAFGGVHQHDLSPGSGSFDGVFGVTANLRWERFFLNAQAQYYLRTEALDYQMGDLTIVSGGPGFYALLTRDYTLSLQANAFYEDQNSDRSFNQINNQTGARSWYLGPQLAFTWGEHFSANGGVDIPLSIDNRGLQSTPDYRIRAGVSWKF